MELKKAYSSPELAEWGTITDLTQTGQTQPDADCFGGSVFPPGHANGCPPGRGPNK